MIGQPSSAWVSLRRSFVWMQERSQARELVEKRERWLNPEGAGEEELKKRTLTSLYNERPAWLEMAHGRLDEAVLAAYGWPGDLGEEEVLGRLLELNMERGEGEAAQKGISSSKVS